MSGISDYSTTPDDNTTINGINIGEHCPARNLNDAIRQMMADVATSEQVQEKWNKTGFPGCILDFYGTIDTSGHPIPCYWNAATSAWVAYGFSLTNWHVCDGTNGTPDMRDRVSVGAGNQYKVGDTGGADTVTPDITIAPATQKVSIGNTTLSTNQLASHGHTSVGFSHDEYIGG